MTEMTIETNGAGSARDARTARRREIEGLRRASDLLCLWRVCGNAVCRRARSCRGRAHLCAKRNCGAVPPPVREFFLSFLAAKSVGVDFEDFRDEMEGRDETEAFFAWRKACSRGAGALSNETVPREVYKVRTTARRIDPTS